MSGPNFQVVPGMPEHAKVRRLGNERLAAMGLWSMCGAWCVANSTEGFVPREVVTRYSSVTADATSLADLLVAAGLWVEKEFSGEDGYVFHDWDDVNSGTSAAERKRNATRRRVQRYRNRKRASELEEQTEDRNAGNALQGVTGNALRNALQPPPPSSPPHTPPLPTPPTGGLATTHPESGSHAQEGVAGGEPSRKRSGAAQRGTRLPDDWEPEEKLKQWVRDNCEFLDNRQKRVQTQDFCDYWHAKAGKEALKIDWELTYKRWMRSQNERARSAAAGGRGGVGSPPRTSTSGQRAAQVDALRQRPGDGQGMIIDYEPPQLGD